MKGKRTLTVGFLVTLFAGTRVAFPGLLVVGGPTPGSMDWLQPSTRWFALSSPLRDPRLAARWRDPWRPRHPDADPFFTGRFGVSSWALLPSSFQLERPIAVPNAPSFLTPSLALGAVPVPPLLSDPSDVLPLPFPALFVPKKLCLQRPVTFLRSDDESETFSLTTCDGFVAPFALDKLTAIARPVDIARPLLPLPDEPVSSPSSNGEWAPGLRLVAPALIWLIQHLADTFPRRSVLILSGYRTGGHTGAHGVGGALDLAFLHVPNESVYRACRALPDTGCGYYPNNVFVHVDVRPAHTGRAFWIDLAAPGEPSVPATSWPGVEEAKSGLLAPP